MQEQIDHEAQLAWLIDPDTRTVDIYRHSQKPEILTDPESLNGEVPVEGFILDLRMVWDPLAG